jgi:hypothetical protein
MQSIGVEPAERSQIDQLFQGDTPMSALTDIGGGVM